MTRPEMRNFLDHLYMERETFCESCGGSCDGRTCQDYQIGGHAVHLHRACYEAAVTRVLAQRAGRQVVG